MLIIMNMSGDSYWYHINNKLIIMQAIKITIKYMVKEDKV